MQVLILAAGMGRRLEDLTEHDTKCMVEVNGKRLIDRALETISAYSIDRIVIVIGYEGERLRSHLGESYAGHIPIHYVVNPIYDRTNNIYSLYLAKEWLSQDDTILLESDLIFSASVFEKAYHSTAECGVLLDRYKSWMDGTVTVLDSNGQISHFISKSEFRYIDVEKYYKTVNIYRFSRAFATDIYIPFLEAYCKSCGHDEYYENVLKVISFVCNDRLIPIFLDSHDKWYEIDDKQDLHNAETIFSDSIRGYQARYGGYWRFPMLRDFCYLVNPYFPPQRMIDEYRTYFETLLHSYPSTSRVQELLCAKMFRVNSDYLLVGNGAAELISILMSLSLGRVGIVSPTFHEYIARVADPHQVVLIESSQPDFSYSIDLLIHHLDTGVDTLVLINPDNPSGHFFSKEELFRLLETVTHRQKRLILDESFVDFSHGGVDNSLIDDHVLESNPNLVIIKSISKSYGVPGIRMGILCTADRAIRQAIKDQMPVWNINSYAEFFLQIYGKYENDYRQACERISQERDYLYEELQKIPYLRTIPTEANYILCEVLAPWRATTLTQEMMSRYDILLKDCTDKTGFKEMEYIRIAVRDRLDNDYLITSLLALVEPSIK